MKLMKHEEIRNLMKNMNIAYSESSPHKKMILNLIWE